MFALEELQKMTTSELITIIGNYISDQEIWLNQAKELEKQNDTKSAEIEQLTEENSQLKMALARADLQVQFQIGEADIANKKSEELQKQVDELKEQRDVFKRLFESVNTSHFSTNSIIETMNSFYREQAEHLAGLKIEQATKDTAKEYHDTMQQEFMKSNNSNFYEFWCNFNNNVAKRFGVGVE